jgi:hypothetical protein
MHSSGRETAQTLMPAQHEYTHSCRQGVRLLYTAMAASVVAAVLLKDAAEI